MVTKMSDSSEEDVELAEAEGSENVSGGEGEREEMEEEIVENNPLSSELAGESLSLLCKTGNGLGHAYVKMNLKDKGLTDVVILKNYKHIRYLDISGNALEDISSLGALTHLLTIKADHNKLTSAQIPGLQYLQAASFSSNHITSPDGMAYPMLEVLNLSSNMISELTGINSKNLPCLRILDLHANQLQTLSGLHLPTLQRLYLASNRITQCDGIQGLVQLTTLHLRNNLVSTLDAFTPSLKALQYINLRGNGVETISEVSKLKSLPLLRALVVDESPVCEEEEYRVEVCLALRQLERIDKDKISEDERADAEELSQQRQKTEDAD